MSRRTIIALETAVDRARINSVVGRVPIVLSLTAFLIVMTTLVTGWERGVRDEGALAHLWQLSIALQTPFILAYLATADWSRFRTVLSRVGLQAAALLLALAPVFILRL
jgi:hypothetical protein